MKRKIAMILVMVVIALSVTACSTGGVNEFDKQFKVKSSLRGYYTEKQLSDIEAYINAYMKSFSKAIQKNDVFVMLEDAETIQLLHDKIGLELEYTAPKDDFNLRWDIMSSSFILNNIQLAGAATDLGVELGEKQPEITRYVYLASLFKDKDLQNTENSKIQTACVEHIKKRMKQILDASFE